MVVEAATTTMLWVAWCVRMVFERLSTIYHQNFPRIWNGIYPLTAFSAKQPHLARSRAISPETAESVKSVTPEPTDVETRKIVTMMCDVKSKEESCDLVLTIVLRMDDKMNRHLTSCISPRDNPKLLAQELVHYGFVNEVDRDKIAALIEETLQNSSGHSSPTHQHNFNPALTDSLSAIPPQQPAMMNSLPAVNSVAASQVPMHTTS
ncbi:hypothetical protein GWI33_018989 [Rhynchophorus ferrugineus]|uniref:Uncharacterized protein n=1 Tax=Rhynchophorus ferrugineus TaxID=354439 RepID=A0A834HSB2_RHYFE|nr:hypothetical protein GWI33_018989 [Rhynchophorus ferrugineus]